MRAVPFVSKREPNIPQTATRSIPATYRNRNVLLFLYNIPLDKTIIYNYNMISMDILEFGKEEEQEMEVEVVTDVGNGVVTTGEVVLINNDEGQMNAKIAEIEARKRRLERMEWAESKNIISGEPTLEGLKKVWGRLKKGKRLAMAIRGVCSIGTWRKWRNEYPEIAAMEEQCREERIARLEEEMLAIADSPDRDKMGQVSKDRLKIDVRQSQIDRLDRLTEARMNLEKKNTPIVPIQINVKYGKPKPGDPDYVAESGTTDRK